MNHQTIIILAKRFLEIATAKDYIDWALSQMKLGSTEEKIIDLAGMSYSSYSFDTENLFKKICLQLNIEIQIDITVIEFFLVQYCNDILIGKESINDGINSLNDFHMFLLESNFNYRKLNKFHNIVEAIESFSYNDGLAKTHCAKLKIMTIEEVILGECRDFINSVQTINQ